MSLSCRLCHSHSIRLAFTSSNIHGRHQLSNENFPLYLCQHCGAYFLDNIETKPHYYSQYYPESYYSNRAHFLDNFLNFIFYQPKLNLINHYFVSKKNISVLDIGCGTGEFLKYLPKKIIKSGVEINSQALKYIDQSQINLYIGNLNEIDFKKQQFDCIVLFHVLEHLPDPQKSLKIIHKLLKKNGLLVFSVPNSDSLGFKVGKQNYFHLDSPRHLFIPNFENIKILLSKTGFHQIDKHPPLFDYPLDLFWSVRKKWIRLFINIFYPIFKVLDWETIVISAVK